MDVETVSGFFPFERLVFDDSDIYLSMGKGYRPTEEIKEHIRVLMQEVSGICTPRYFYSFFPAGTADKNSVTLDKIRLRTGKIITSYIGKADRYALFVITAGREFEEMQKAAHAEGDIYREFLLDCLGTAIAEASVRALCGRIEESVPPGVGVSFPYSPGYCGWNISEQSLLFGQIKPPENIVRLTDSFLMSPIKSVSGIIATGKEIRKQKYGCELCRRKDCYKNKLESSVK